MRSVIWPSFGLGQASIDLSHWQGGQVRLSFAAPAKPGAAGRRRQAARRQRPLSFIGSKWMSIFGKIMSAIFGSHAASGAPAGGASAPAGGGAAAAPSAAPAQSIDVAPILDKAA